MDIYTSPGSVSLPPKDHKNFYIPAIYPCHKIADKEGFDKTKIMFSGSSTLQVGFNMSVLSQSVLIPVSLIAVC